MKAETLWATSLAAPPAVPPVDQAGVLWLATQTLPPAAPCAYLEALDLATGKSLAAATFEQAVATGLTAVPGAGVLLSLSGAGLENAARVLAWEAPDELHWEARVDAWQISAAAVGREWLYVNGDARTLLILERASGKLAARVALSSPPAPTAPLVEAAEVYIPCRGPDLLALDARGALRWRFALPAAAESVWLDKTPALTETSLVSVSSAGQVVALRRDDGGMLWLVEVGPSGKALSEPVVVGPRVYVGARDGLHALDVHTGRELWVWATAQPVLAQPVVLGNVVYAACRDRYIYALEAATGHLLWRCEAMHSLKLKPIVTAELLCYVDRAGNLKALRYPASLRPPAPPPELSKPRFTPAADTWATLTIRIAACQPDKGYPVDLALDVPGRDVLHEMERGYIPVAALRDWVPGGDLVADGRRLFRALVEDSRCGREWGRVEGLAPQRRIQLQIDRDAPELHRLPWELLRDKTLFSADANTPFSRLLPSATPWGQVIRAPALRLLVLLANPTDLAAYNLAPLPVEAYAQLFAELNAAGPFHFDILEPPVTPARLEQALRSGHYHGMHFVGHGAFNAARQETALFFQREDGAVERVSGAQLCDALVRLHDQQRPRLVFLAACHSATSAVDNPFVGLGPLLGRVGVPVVVAMQDVIQMQAARVLTQNFYQQLMAHGVVDRALNEARGTLDTLAHPNAATAVLFLRLKSGRLWQPE